MPKKSSEKNRCVKAACIFAVVLLCLGGFFVIFLSDDRTPQTQSAIAQPSTSEKTVFCTSNIQSNSLSVSAKSAILIEVSTGNVLYEKNADTVLPMASTTKIMTALVALENADISKTVSVSPTATGVEGSSVYLYPEEKLTLEELLYAMLLESANDAAAAIAIEVGGSIEGFAQMMNRKAESLGLSYTHFENPHGLDGEAHHTTARELAIIAREAYSNSEFKKIVSTYKKTIPLNETEGVRLLINHNKMLKSYEGATGIKTGFTKKSGRCLVSAAERNGLEFIAVTLNAPSDWQDHTAMLDYGFEQIESRMLCGSGEISYTLPTVGGDADHVIVKNLDTVRVVLPKNSPEIECKIELPQFVYAPVNKGDVIGKIVFYLNGQRIAESNLAATTSVEKTNKKRTLTNPFKF